jgi:Tfp pilus assembly protein PilO
MSARGRLIAAVLAAIVVVAAVWLIAVSPERSKASNLLAQIASERQTLASAQAQLLAARAARADYPAEVHAMQVLLDAIPTSDQEPQLIDLINALENGYLIDWKQTSLSPSSAGGFGALQISFAFQASYMNLQRFVTAVDSLDKSDGANVISTGRLATVNSIELSPSTNGQETASVSMTVYQQSTGGATGAGGTTTTAGAQG